MKYTIFYSKRNHIYKESFIFFAERKIRMINASMHALHMKNMKNVEILLPKNLVFMLFIQQMEVISLLQWLYIFRIHVSFSKIIFIAHE